MYDRNHRSVTRGQKKEHSRLRQSDPSLFLVVKFVFSCGALEIKSWQESAAFVLWVLNRSKVGMEREHSLKKSPAAKQAQ